MTDCPLCKIPEKEELLYSDDLIYLVRTQDPKGHLTRVMVCTHRHTKEPTFVEQTKAITVLEKWMTDSLGRKEWYMCDSTHCSLPDHWHIVACDSISIFEAENLLLADTVKVKFPLKGNVMIGIPAHNEHDTIGKVVREAKKYGEVYVYCDGCTDYTAGAATVNGAEVIEAKVNMGYGYGLNELFKIARDQDFDYFITLDGDGQHNPAEIPRFLQALGNADLVIGNRFLGNHDTPYYRQIVIKVINGILGVGDSQCGFRGYNREAMKQMVLTEYRMGASIEILNLADGLKIVEVPCSISYEDQTHSTPAIQQGGMLANTIFWSMLWKKPLVWLGIPTILLMSLGLYWIAKTAILYRTLNTFASGLAFSGIASIMLSILLGMAGIFVMVTRRMITEMKR